MKLARHIEGFYLYPDASLQEVTKFLVQARKLEILGVTVSPIFIRAALPLLKGSTTFSFAAIDFPLGQSTPKIKALAAREAVIEGAIGVEVMVDTSMVKLHNFRFIQREALIIRNMIGGKVPFRMAIESSLLTPYEIVGAAQAAVAGGAGGIVVGTPFGKHSAKESDVRFVRKAVGPDKFVKACAGLKGLSKVKELIKAGADTVSVGDPKKILLE